MSYLSLHLKTSIPRVLFSHYITVFVYPYLIPFVSWTQTVTVLLLGKRGAVLYSHYTLGPVLHLFSYLKTIRTIKKVGQTLSNRFPTTKETDTVVFYIHGGGFNLYTETERFVAAGLFHAQLPVDVFVAEYPLAPGARMSTVFSEIMSQYTECCAMYPTRDVVVAGDSAGGYLAVNLLLALADESARTAPIGALLLSPWLDVDLSASLPSSVNNLETDYMTRAFLECFAHGTELGGGVPPFDELIRRVSMVKRKLPPVYIVAGGGELMADEARALAVALDGGGGVGLYLADGCPHDFTMSPFLCKHGVEQWENTWDAVRRSVKGWIGKKRDQRDGRDEDAGAVIVFAVDDAVREFVAEALSVEYDVCVACDKNVKVTYGVGFPGYSIANCDTCNAMCCRECLDSGVEDACKLCKK